MTTSVLNRIAVVMFMLFSASIILGSPASAEMISGQEAGIININDASLSELADLKGIGKVKAEAIIAYRKKNGKFESIDDINNVNGVGKKTIDKIRERITVK